MHRSTCLAVAALAFAAGCASGGDREETRTEGAPGSVGRDELAIMPLPAAALGDAAAGLRIDAAESGYNDNAAGAEDTIDPDDTAADLSAAGRRIGYDLSFADDDLSSLYTGAGVVYAASGVELFDTPKQARAYLERQVRDRERLAGTEVEEGIRLVRARSSEVAGIGETAWAVEAVYSLAGREVHESVVAFTFGPLVGAVGVVRADRRPIGSQVERLARALERRVRGVAAGQIRERPVPIPRASEAQASGNEPTGDAKALEGMVLTLAEVPSGATVETEGFRRGGRGRWAYARLFDLRRAQRGASYLSMDAELYSSPDEAAATLERARAVLRGKAGERFFSGTLGRQTGIEAEDVRIAPLDVPRIGGGSSVVSASFSTPAGRVRAVFAFVRVGPVLGSFYAFGPAARFRPNEAVPLVRRFAARIAERSGAA